MNHQLAEVLTIEELSIYLKIPRSTLYKIVREGKVPGQKVGRHWRFHKEAIDRWLDTTLHDDAQARRGAYLVGIPGNSGNPGCESCGDDRMATPMSGHVVSVSYQPSGRESGCTCCGSDSSRQGCVPGSCCGSTR